MDEARAIAVSPRHTVLLAMELYPLVEKPQWQDFVVRTRARREVNGMPLMAAELDESGIASYRLSKWALNGLVRLQAQHLRGAIAVNGLDPGWVKTELGGPRAPGVPEDSARAALALLREPFETTGKLFKDGAEIAY